MVRLQFPVIYLLSLVAPWRSAAPYRNVMTGANNRIRLAVLNAALGPLDYRLPKGMAAPVGSVVVAPLGPRKVMGIVWDEGRLPGDEIAFERLRPILEVVPVPPLPAPLRRLIEWTADYYCAPLAAVARMALASGGALGGPATTTEYRLSGSEGTARLTAQRKQAVAALADEQGTIRELAGIAGVSQGVLRGMMSAGLLEPVSVAIDRPYPAADPDYAQPDLSKQQAEVAQTLVDAVQARALPPSCSMA
jgi:primosomal protein N' (replication factor Y) (superfamily II helicase)